MNRSQHLVIGVLVAALAASAAVENNEEYRLPNNTVPHHYEIRLIPRLDNGEFKFEGEVRMDVEVLARTFTVLFHADEIEIDEGTALVTSLNGNHTIANTTYDPDLNFYGLEFEAELLPGNYSIHLEYEGTLDSEMQGFYRSYYNTSHGETRWLASTQFEPVYARQAFPCFDEPGLKASFAIAIAHWPNQTALSNGAALKSSTTESTTDGRVWTRFETTPPMSTYLVAFVVSDFGHLAKDDSFRIWTRPEALDTAAYALTVGGKILNELNAYTAHDFYRSFSKLDQIAIPDFSAGAMENWGLVTYRERLLLFKDGVATSRNKQNIATTISHELAHQWFGNLVTPRWWNHLWLNEGFATYFEYVTTAGVETGWRLDEQFTVIVMHAALLTDSLDTSHPVNDNVRTPSQINSFFDTITYNKAGSVIRMMVHFLGERVFRNGLRLYLTANAHKNAVPDDLWSALTASNNEAGSPTLQSYVDVKTVMETWTNQKGYPVVNVRRNYTSSVCEVTQERFLLKGRGSSNDTHDYRWWIPISYVHESRLSANSTSPSVWIRNDNESVAVNAIPNEDWVLFNVRQAGYYRVNYDDANWGRLADYLNDGDNYANVDVVNRAQLIDDTFNLARAGYLKYSVAVPLTRYLARETEYAPWVAAFNGFTHLHTMLANSVGYENFTIYVSSRVRTVHETLGFAELPSDEHVTKMLRLSANSWACQTGSAACRDAARTLLLSYYENPEPRDSTISADLKSWAYCEGLRQADASVWNFLWERYLSSDFSGEQALILSSLGCSQNEEILNNYLTYSITPSSGMRRQDTYSVFTSVYSSSSRNVDIALNFLVNNWAAISEFYDGMNSIATILQGLAEKVVTEEQFQKLKDFVDRHEKDLGVAAAAAERAIELAEENLSWLELYEEDIIGALAEEVGRIEGRSSAIGACFVPC